MITIFKVFLKKNTEKLHTYSTEAKIYYAFCIVLVLTIIAKYRI